MDGITILNTVYEYGYNFSKSWIALAFIACFIFIVLAVLGLSDDNALMIFIGLIGAIISLVIGCALATSLEEDESDIKAITYQVTIDDSVSFQEFNDKYEIISQEGLIYTIKEKE